MPLVGVVSRVTSDPVTSVNRVWAFRLDGFCRDTIAAFHGANGLQPLYVPVSWCFNEPIVVGTFQWNVGVQPSRNCLVDDGLALLFQQGDEPLFGADVAADELVGVVDVADDGGLFFQWGNR